MTPQADVLLVTVTKIETRAVFQAFRDAAGADPRPEAIGDKTYHDLGTVNATRVWLVQSEMGAGGLGAAQQTVQKGIETLAPSAVVMVGIAFGVNPDKQQIGDILVASKLMLYEPQRVGAEDDAAARAARRLLAPPAGSLPQRRPALGRRDRPLRAGVDRREAGGQPAVPPGAARLRAGGHRRRDGGRGAVCRVPGSPRGLDPGEGDLRLGGRPQGRGQGRAAGDRGAQRGPVRAPHAENRGAETGASPRDRSTAGCPARAPRPRQRAAPPCRRSPTSSAARRSWRASRKRSRPRRAPGAR